MLSALSLYVEENKMAINVKKTKCMIFNKTGKFIRRTYPTKNGNIETTNSYKYLGFIFTPSGEITSGLKDLKERAMRAYQKLKNKLGTYFRLHPLTAISLFDSLVKPILMYSSDFWQAHYCFGQTQPKRALCGWPYDDERTQQLLGHEHDSAGLWDDHGRIRANAQWRRMAGKWQQS